MDQRLTNVLRTLIEQYIADGRPVSSKAIASALEESVSAATVRNLLALLEGQGLVVAPHTSAGRIPTEQGYRVFVDSLVRKNTLAEATVNKVKDCLHPDMSAPEMIAAASKVLSELTSMACVVTNTSGASATLKHIEFLPLEQYRVLAVLVFSNDSVENRIFTTDVAFTKAQLNQASGLLNQRFAGAPLKAIRHGLIAQLNDHRQQLDGLMRTAIQLAEKAIDPETPEPECVVTGQTNLLYIADEKGGADRLRQLFDLFQQKRDLLGLMDSCIKAQGVQIFIGQESGYQHLEACSLVMSSYVGSHEDVLGSLAVIGPTRMPYDDVIPTVDLTAKILSAALKKSS